MREVLYVTCGAHIFGIGPFSGKSKDGEFISSNYEAAVLAEFGSKERWESAISNHLDLRGDKYRQNVSLYMIPEFLVGLFAPESSSV